ncbi:hypothetical protein CHS0354_007416 [Potamilus streckersoni]|uniref:Uncharacterized protein n=1 Tax=Potamilus streckersoni TaxID=2493646 RepID=A0AAE0W2M5_9BIVA|nr:hypothetical protein CHS0354_007416 [Potamilus streckersoni]
MKTEITISCRRHADRILERKKTLSDNEVKMNSKKLQDTEIKKIMDWITQSNQNQTDAYSDLSEEERTVMTEQETEEEMDEEKGNAE